MNKQDLITELKNKISSGDISRSELENLVQHMDNSQKNKLPTIAYYLGAAIVFIGIFVLVIQNWQFFNFLSRFLITAGSAAVAYITGAYLTKHGKDNASQVPFLISGLVAPLALYVIFNKIGIVGSDYNLFATLTSGILLAMFLYSTFLFKKPILTFFSISYATWLFFSFTSFLATPAIVFQNSLINKPEFLEYRALTTGLAYIILGVYFSKQQNPLENIYHTLGALIFLTSAVFLGGYRPYQNTFWEITFPALACGSIFISTLLKRNSYLVLGSLFLMIYIFKITSEYFSQNLGWPLSLILTGFAFISLGYYSLYIKKKYINV